MTVHDIPELERQWRAAQDKARQAALAEREEKQRLRDAKLDATGLKGHKVSYQIGGVLREFVVTDLSRHIDTILRGKKIKKNGALSSFEDSAYISDLTDHGPYQEPK